MQASTTAVKLPFTLPLQAYQLHPILQFSSVILTLYSDLWPVLCFKDFPVILPFQISMSIGSQIHYGNMKNNGFMEKIFYNVI